MSSTVDARKSEMGRLEKKTSDNGNNTKKFDQSTMFFDPVPYYFPFEEFDAQAGESNCKRLADEAHEQVLRLIEEFLAEQEAQAPPPVYHTNDWVAQFLERAWRVLQTASPDQFAGVDLGVSGILKTCVVEKSLSTNGRRILVESFDAGYPSAASFLHGVGATSWLGRDAGKVELASIHDVVSVLERGGRLSSDLKTYRKAGGTLYLPHVTSDSYLTGDVNATFASLLRLDCKKTNLCILRENYDGDLDQLLMSFLEETK